MKYRYQMNPVRRKVIGECVIAEERIISTKRTKNVIKQRIERVHTRAIELECGHKIPVTNFNKVPTSNTQCFECDPEHEPLPGGTEWVPVESLEKF